jgi:hypothetical protein
MLIFKTKELIPVTTGLNQGKTIYFNMSILKDESKKITTDFYVIPHNKIIEINFQFEDVGIEALLSFDNNKETNVIFAITWEELLKKAQELLGFDSKNQEAYDKWIESDWNDIVYSAFKTYIFIKIEQA